MTDAIKLALDKCEKAAIESGAHESFGIVRESFAELRAAIAALREQPAIGLQTAIRLVLEATPEQLPMAIDALRDFAQPDHCEQHLGMVAAARAVVERWDTPLWKDAPATAVYINRLRDALPAIGETME